MFMKYLQLHMKRGTSSGEKLINKQTRKERGMIVINYKFRGEEFERRKGQPACRRREESCCTEVNVLLTSCLSSPVSRHSQGKHIHRKQPLLTHRMMHRTCTDSQSRT